MATTYKKVLKTIEVNTLGGTTVEVSDTATKPFASNAYVEFKNRKTMHIQLADNETLIPFHAIDDVIETISATDVERSDPYCKEVEPGGDCVWSEITLLQEASYEEQVDGSLFMIGAGVIGIGYPFRITVGDKVYESVLETDCIGMLTDLDECPESPQDLPLGEYAMFFGDTIMLHEYFAPDADYSSAKVEVCYQELEKVTLVLSTDEMDESCLLDGSTICTPKELCEFFEEHCHYDESEDAYITDDGYVTVINGVTGYAKKLTEIDTSIWTCSSEKWDFVIVYDPTQGYTSECVNKGS